MKPGINPLEDVSLGDVVRLRNGETFTVGHKFSSYTDRDGEHEGPFVSPRGASDHYLLADVTEVVERNPRRCVYCGEGVTATNPETDFCSGCYYGGRAFEDIYAALLGRIRPLDGVSSADFWHTGGGCWVLAVRLADGRLLTPSEGFEEDGKVWPEPTIPDADGRWTIVAAPDEDAWNEWEEDRLVLSHALYTEDELVEAIGSLAADPGALEVAA